MGDWCKNQFGWDAKTQTAKPGKLADQVRKSTIRLEEVDQVLHEFVSTHVRPGGGMLAGNTVHMDKRFLDKFCPKFMGTLHYRIVDVSTVKELCRRWAPDHFRRAPVKRCQHRAMEDIYESLKELEHYQQAGYFERCRLKCDMVDRLIGCKDMDMCHVALSAKWKSGMRLLRIKRVYFRTILAGLTFGPPAEEWLLDGRAHVDVPEDQVGMPGDKYLVTFRWEKYKELTWEKLSETGPVEPGKYYLCGPWSGWDFVEMQPDTTGPRRRRKGWYSVEVQVSSLPSEFLVVRNQDFRQAIYPQAPPAATGLEISQHSAMCGPDDGESGLWKIQDLRGAVYKIFFYRDPEDCEPTSMRVDWKKVEEEREYHEPEAAYYVNSSCNDFSHRTAIKMTLEEDGEKKLYSAELGVQELALDPKKPTERQPIMPFNILVHRLKDHCIHPDQELCTLEMEQTVALDENSKHLTWCIGKQSEDDAAKGDTFSIRLVVFNDNYSVSWRKVS
ncbi:unnamed protein product [Effrenium voratum]|uniref:Exonuclease domain-containing protein n=1 Tax=Effrenium voratum TaxID=2562239 RepID=A0AA36J604_9DINO|nr:unnamed protein product [Effrenium voratum]